MTDDDNTFDLSSLAEVAANMPPAIRPWVNPDTHVEQYLVVVHPNWFVRLSARDRWRIEHSRARAYRRYGFPMLPEWAIGKLSASVAQLFDST